MTGSLLSENVDWGVNEENSEDKQHEDHQSHKFLMNEEEIMSGHDKQLNSFIRDSGIYDYSLSH